MLTEKEKELIDKFLLNNLDEKETFEFNRLKTNAEFAEELEIMSRIRKMTIDFGRQKLKLELEEIINLERPHNIYIVSLIQNLKYPIAASLIFVCGLSIILNKEYNMKGDKYLSHSGGASIITISNKIEAK